MSNLKMNLLFDADYYNATHLDVSSKGIDPFLHFTRYGIKEGRAFKSNYDLIAIIQDYKTLREQGNHTQFEVFVDGLNLEAYRKTNDMADYVRHFIDAAAQREDVADRFLATLRPPLNRYQFELESNERQRISLIVPTLNDAGVYGGIQTALDFFSFLIDTYGDAYDYRLISHNDQLFGNFITTYANRHHFAFDPLNASGRRSIVSGAARSTESAPLRRNEILITTFWATSIAVQAGLKVAGVENVRICNFVQDYEPNFYPQNSLAYLCRETLGSDLVGISIVNSTCLAEFLGSRGDIDGPAIPFTPRLNAALRPLGSPGPDAGMPQDQGADDQASNVLLFYARSNPRNLFEVGRIALMRFVAEHPEIAQHYSFVGVGEISGEIDLGSGRTLSCLGKLTMGEYASWLARARVGLSLMMAPHPSYPPLEMAFNGLRVVTNDYDKRQMAGAHVNILSAERPSVSALVDLLAIQCQAALVEKRIVGAPFGSFLTGFEKRSSPFSPLVENPAFTAVFGE